MNQINKHNYFVLTGAMGTGKSTILNQLRKLGILCIDEPARQILSEQRAIEGSGVPDCDPKLFTDLLLSRSIYQFKQMGNHLGPVIYDRGIPDNIGYAGLFDLDSHSATKAGHQYQYNKHIFFLPAWEEIYENDDERKMTFSQAKSFGDEVRKIYENLGYNIIEVPLLPPYERAEFIVNTIVKKMASQSAILIETAPDCQNILEGYVYLKQTPPAIALEAKIAQVLHDLFNASTPTIIASNTELNCFLMKDAGLSLREILKEKFDSELVCRAVDQFTSLQIAVADRIDVLLDVGVPDWRLENFPDLYREVISDKKLLMDDGLSEIEIDEAGAVIPKISTLCTKLSSYSIKQTIVQPDCNDNNMLMDNISKTITHIDLGELAISHPFFSLLNFLHIIKKHHALKEQDESYIWIKRACLMPYMIFESEENISDAFSTAQDLWFVYGILAHYRLMLACGKESIMSWQRGKLSSLFRGFMAL